MIHFSNGLQCISGRSGRVRIAAFCSVLAVVTGMAAMPVMGQAGADSTAGGAALPAEPATQPAASSDSGAITPSTEPAGLQLSEQQIMQGWGWYLATQRHLTKIEINDTEMQAFLKGATDAVHGGTAPPDLEKAFWDVQHLLKERRAKMVAETRRKNLEQANAFVANLKKNPKVIELPGNVYYEVIKEGNGPQPQAQQTVTIHYVGHLLDGTEFVDYGPTESILLPRQAFCRGWLDALQKMKKQEQIKLYVPPPLSDEESDRWGVPAGAMLVFDVDLQDMRATTAEELQDATAAPPPEPPMPARSNMSDAEVFERLGWVVAQGTGLPFNDSQTAWFLKGLTAAIKGEPSEQNEDQLALVIERVATEREAQAAEAYKTKQLAAADAFFAKVKQQPGIVTLPDGLCYEIKTPGVGEFPRKGQIVYVNYVGHLINGVEFDKSVDEPLSIELGQYMPGWDEGIQKLRKGGKMKLYIPPNLAYGEDAVGSVPPHSTLIYDLELVDVKDAPATEPTTEPATLPSTEPAVEVK